MPDEPTGCGDPDVGSGPGRSLAPIQLDCSTPSSLRGSIHDCDRVADLQECRGSVWPAAFLGDGRRPTRDVDGSACFLSLFSLMHESPEWLIGRSAPAVPERQPPAQSVDAPLLRPRELVGESAADSRLGQPGPDPREAGPEVAAFPEPLQGVNRGVLEHRQAAVDRAIVTIVRSRSSCGPGAASSRTGLAGQIQLRTWNRR